MMLIAESFTDIGLTQCKLYNLQCCAMPSCHHLTPMATFSTRCCVFLARELSIVFVNTSSLEVEHTTPWFFSPYQNDRRQDDSSVAKGTVNYLRIKLTGPLVVGSMVYRLSLLGIHISNTPLLASLPGAEERVIENEHGCSVYI